MSETTPQTTAGAALTAEQQAFLAAQQAQQAAAEGAGISQAQQDTAAAMTQRGPLLPAEEGIDALMAQIRAQSEQIAQLMASVGTVQRQMEEAQAASCGPLTVRYAQGAADKIAAHAAQWPAHDLKAAADAAGRLVEAATAAAKTGDPQAHAALTAAGSVIGRVFRKLPHIDASAILDDVELAVEEGVKLLAA